MDRSAHRLSGILKGVFFENLSGALTPADYQAFLREMAGRQTDPYTVAETMFARMVRKTPPHRAE